MRVNVAARVRELPVYLFGKLNALKYEKRRKGLDVIDLGMGNPLDPTPKAIVDKLCQAVQDELSRTEIPAFVLQSVAPNGLPPTTSICVPSPGLPTNRAEVGPSAIC